MSKRGNAYGHNRVNILKKVRVGKNWNLYPAPQSHRTLPIALASKRLKRSAAVTE
jgi:hypothetical protein